jgi:hypothetical protein
MTFVKTNAARNLKIRNTKQKEKQWRVNGWILNNNYEICIVLHGPLNSKTGFPYTVNPLK